MKTNTKKKSICDTNTTTWTNIWKIANSIQSKNMKILRANLICNDWREFNVMIIAGNFKKE